ncbi:MAG: hypothetical protein EOO20_02805 [Chryseobacterium sp.]|nr:MAG: hypothetical protein EOO20_02805 [Chryseobacterium sp.]
MSKKTKHALSLVNIEIIGQEMSFTTDFKPSNIFDYGLEIESRYDPTHKLAIIKLLIEIRADGFKCASQTGQYWFNVSAFESEIKRGRDGHYQIPADLQIQMNDIAVNTARGLMYSQFKGTLLHTAILPVIDPTEI